TVSPSVIHQYQNTFSLDACRPAHHSPINGNSTMEMTFIPIEILISSTASTPWPRHTAYMPATTQPTIRESLCPEATKEKINSGFAAEIHWARAGSQPCISASLGT